MSATVAIITAFTGIDQSGNLLVPIGQSGPAHATAHTTV